MGKKRACFLSQFTSVPCDGRLRKVHLVSKHRLGLKGADPWDERAWVWACGGWTGLEGHHGMLDAFQLVIPRAKLPPEVEALADEFHLHYQLDRRYGPRHEPRTD